MKLTYLDLIKITIFISVQIVLLNITLAVAGTLEDFGYGSNNLQTRINDLKAKSDLTLPLEEEIDLLRQLDSFDLGRFLLRHGKLNGYWRAYLLFEAPKKHLTNSLEDWYVNRSPITIASRERFYIFQQEVKSYLEQHSDVESLKIASIPCGMMYDLLTIDYENFSNNIELVGIDIDSNLLKLAQVNSEVYYKKEITKFFHRDAWDLSMDEEFDVIISHGLMFYESNPNRVIDLYKEFHKSLKKDGVLITSFLTPLPDMPNKSPWQNYEEMDMLKEVALYKDIIKIDCQYYTEKHIKKYLEQAGFKIIKVINDSGHIFPTIVAQKIN